jgi:hypothetical protein
VGYLSLLIVYWPWALLFVLLTLLPGFILPLGFIKKYASFLLVLGILTWIQAGMLLWDYGVFDGRGTDWEQFDTSGWLNILLWLGALVVSLRFADYILPYSNIIAWILIFGQAVLLLSQGGLKPEEWIKNHHLSASPPETIFEVSQQQNVIHIVLDSMQTDVFLELIEKHDLNDVLSGFTLFYENAGVTPHTSLALPAIFSGEIFDGSQSPADYYKGAMTGGFQSRLFQAGFIVNLIPQLSMRKSSYTNYYEVPSIWEGTIDDLKSQNAVLLLEIALFRSAPHFLRKALYNDGEWFLLPIVRGDLQVTSFQEKAFFRDYTQNLKLGNNTPAYHFIHLMPPHPPFVTLPDGKYAGSILPNTRENYLNESWAITELIVQYIRKLKSLGVYEDSLIILQGDHGSQINPVVQGKEIQTCVSRMAALLAVKPPRNEGLVKVSNAPTSLLDVAPTILKVVDEEGQSVFDLDDSLVRERPFLVFNSKDEVAKIIEYTINGSVFDPQSCKRGKSLEINSGISRYEVGNEILFGMTGNADSFMGVGWSACQDDYCWSVGNLADINLPIEKVTTDLMLQVRFKPFLDKIKAPQQRIGVAVNGTLLTEWLVSRFDFQSASVRVPKELARGDTLQISFHLPDAVSPKALDLGWDGRLLGIAINTLRVDVLNDE